MSLSWRTVLRQPRAPPALVMLPPPLSTTLVERPSATRTVCGTRSATSHAPGKPSGACFPDSDVAELADGVSVEQGDVIDHPADA